MLASLALLMLTAAEPDQPPPTPPQKPKLVCREGEQELGTHIHTGRRCKTAEEWQVEDQLKDTMPATLKVIPGKAEGVPQPTRPPL
jgi:hypothetical protein